MTAGRLRLADLGSLLAGAALSVVVVLASYLTTPLLAVAVLAAGAGAALVVARPVIGIYAGVLAILAEQLTVGAGAVGLSAAEAIFLATAGCAVLHLLAGRSDAHVDLAHIAFGSLVFIATLGLFFAVDVAILAKIVLMWSVFLTLSVLASGADEQQVRRIVIAIVLSCAALSVLAVAGAGDIQLREGGQGADGRAAGAFNHPNLLAQYLVLGLPLALVLAVTAQGRWRPVAIAAAAIITLALLLTLTRAAIIGGGVGVLALIALWPRFRRAAAVVLCVLMVGAPLGLSAILQTEQARIVETRLSTVGGEAETNPRLRIYQRAPDMLADRPFLGIGLGNFSVWSPLYGMRDKGGATFEHAHNVLLTIAIETGLIGFGAALVFLWRMVGVCVRVVRLRAAPLHPIGVGIVAAFCSLGTVSLTDYPLRSNPVTAVLLIEVGLVLAVLRLSAGRTSEHPAGTLEAAPARPMTRV